MNHLAQAANLVPDTFFTDRLSALCMSRTRLSLCYLCSKLVGSVGRFYCPGA